jgi:hypothetical protein
MQKLLFLTILIVSLASASDYKVCTQSAQELSDDIFTLIEAFESDPYAPPAEDFKIISKALAGFFLKPQFESLSVPHAREPHDTSDLRV